MRRTFTRSASIVAVAVVAVLSGCSSGDSGAHASKGSSVSTVGVTTASSVGPTLTGGGTSGTAPGSVSPAWTAQQQAVIDRVTTYHRIVDAMAGGAALNMDQLRSVGTPTFAQKIGQNIQLLKGNQQVVRNVSQIKYVPTSVDIAGTQATYVECYDARATYLVDHGTARTADGSTASATLDTLTLAMTAGEWKVASSRSGGTC